MDSDKYLKIFIEEAAENMQGMNQALLELEKNPEEETNINNIFRIAHTLKGMSATMNFTKMAKLTHLMEDVLQEVRNKQIKLHSELIDILFDGFDALENYLKSIVDYGNEGNEEYNSIINSLKTIKKDEIQKKEQAEQTLNIQQQCEVHINELNEYEKNVINKAFEIGMKSYYIIINLDKGCVLKSARAYVIFQVLEKYCDIIKSEPSVEDIEDEKFDLSFSVVVVAKYPKETIEKKLFSVSEVESIIIKEFNKESTSCKPEPVNLGQTKSGTDKLHIENSGNEENKEVFITKARSVKTVRVDIEKLDILLNLVGELIIQKTRLEDVSDEKNQTYQESIQYLERIISNLHEAVMKVRMVPVEMVFNRFPRMIRDLSKELGKEIVLTMSGENTELDRTIIDEIGEPIVHLLRNSIDHGIEMPQERIAKGKSEQGHVFLKAYQEGNNVTIEVADDGHGINVERVKEKAVEKGISTINEVLSMTKNDIIDLLFKPGMSTASTVSDISGRGVGLDVVRTKIESLGGVIEIESEPDIGSRFIIRLPLTLAMIQALLVYIGEERYAIPLSNINQILKIKTEDIKFVQKREVILMNDTIVPLIRLEKVLGTPMEVEDKNRITTIIVNKSGKFYALTVDRLIGQQEIVIKNPGKYLSDLKTISGGTILGDGKIAFILDINYFAS